MPEHKSKKPKRISARRVVITSFVVDLGDIVLNVVTAMLTGSVVVLTEALQGAADLLTSGLLWVGVQRSKRQATRRHRFGYGKELFFWILMAGVSMFIITAGFSFYFGLQRVLHPHPVTNIGLAYVVLAIGFCTNVYALSLSLRRLGVSLRHRLSAIRRHVRRSALIETKATTILDLMGASAALLGLISLIIYGITGESRFDGVGAMVVGLSCGVFALMLIFEVKNFIVGRSASPEIELQIRQVANSVSGVHGVLDLRTMQMGSERVMVNMEVHLDHRLRTQEIEQLMDDLKEAVKKDVPEVQHIQVEVETPRRKKLARPEHD
ncbi:MAG TPA: cation diffusion facilitator family transporter [Candidatus Polarisedimenticolaceae bacterium]|nr:cation diffusion facilitator family transporter [Candidatus Polarisedimenticolaceae bacterium]